MEVQRVLPGLADRHGRHAGTERRETLLDLALLWPVEHPHLASIRHHLPQLFLAGLNVLIVEQDMGAGHRRTGRRDPGNLALGRVPQGIARQLVLTACSTLISLWSAICSR